MSLIEKNLLPDERIQFRTKKHLMIFFYPVVLIIVALYAFQYMSGNFIVAQVKWIPILVVLLIFASVWLEYITSQFVVTNRRIIMREGFFYRHSTELRINSISQINVEQGPLGQMLNYGTISINAFGAFDAFTMISHPLQFQKFANEQVDKVMTKG
jgi:uncharacterized membrane protein YdbT with pleckstrin-like domain